MAHFALLDNADNVINVTVVADEDCLDADGNESELVGIDFCVRVAPHLNTTRSNWKQTSYTSFGGKRYNPDTGEEIEGDALRFNYASVGYTYDEKRDAFIPSRRWSSWQLNETTCQWEPPIPWPPTVLDGVNPGGQTDYEWNEEAYQQDRTQGWVLK